jgi:endoglucanase
VTEEAVPEDGFYEGLPKLSVRGTDIVDERGSTVRLRGFGVGGWMNLENFINGFPGVEHRLRARLSQAIGPERARMFFDRLADHFFTDADAALCASLGANVVRLAVNYRHIESDASPFSYEEPGFARLSGALDACARAGIYAIIDLHSAPGWQNPDWHCDNASRSALLWSHSHFVERTERLWAEIAERFGGHRALCGYDLLNEPATGPLPGPGDPSTLNSIYERLVRAVREVDPSSLIFLEGDMFGSQFYGLELPVCDDVVWSFHDYGPAQMGPGAYPGLFRGRFFDADVVAEIVHGLPGPRFAERNGVPLWVGEFGAVFAGRAEEKEDRLRALDDQIAVFERAGWSWTIWTLKDVGAMGLVSVDPESAFGRLVKKFAGPKAACEADTWANWNARGTLSQGLDSLADALFAQGLGQRAQLRDGVAARVGADYAADLLQDKFVAELAAAGDEELEALASSFALAACNLNKQYADLLADRFTARA